MNEIVKNNNYSCWNAYLQVVISQYQYVNNKDKSVGR